MTGQVTSAPLTTRQIVVLAAAAGLVPLNSTMIAVALPAISDEFAVSTSKVSVLITAYLVIMFLGQPLAGRISDRVGSRRLVQLALVGLALFSAAAAVAPTFWVLVVTRGLQAICAAALSPATQSLLTAVSPPDQRGRVFGILGSVLGVGAASGPIVGGALIEGFGWEAIFGVNVPVAMLAAFAARSVRLGADAPARPPAASAVPDHGIGNPVYVAGFAGQALSTFAQYTLLLLTPLILDAQGWGAGSIGLALSALTVGMIVMGPVGGRLGDRLGRRQVVTVGLSVSAVAVGVLALAGRTVEPTLLVGCLAVFGVGLGATTPNLMSAALGSVPPARIGAAAGILSMSRYVGSIGASVTIAVLVADLADGAASVLGIGVACLAVSVATATRLPGLGSGEVDRGLSR